MNIGDVAEASGLPAKTIRYYEDIGLLPQASRRAGGHRVYGAADLRRLTFIRRCRDFGFPIEQVRELVALAGSPERDCKFCLRARRARTRPSFCVRSRCSA